MQKRKVNILKHLGSATNEEEAEALKNKSENWVLMKVNKKGLFGTGKDPYFSNYRLMLVVVDILTKVVYTTH